MQRKKFFSLGSAAFHGGAVNYPPPIMQSECTRRCGGSPEEVLTSRLIRDVYGVKATVDLDDSGRPCIHYAGLVDCEAAE